MLMWKIVERLEVSVIYIYIDKMFSNEGYGLIVVIILLNFLLLKIK